MKLAMTWTRNETGNGLTFAWKAVSETVEMAPAEAAQPAATEATAGAETRQRKLRLVARVAAAA